MTGSIEVARDLAQETMARAHVDWDALADANVPEAWLTRVMKNLVIDHWRRQQVETKALGRLANRRQHHDDIGGGSRLAELVDILPERQRVVVSLVYGADLSIAQVADALTIAPGTVKATLWKARRSIRRHLAEEAHDD